MIQVMQQHLSSDIHVFELPAVGEADSQCDMQRRPKI